jgi:menaquinone-dependent protoporphyrinogen oxidase
MENAVLVAYATKYGATAEIAEKIGEVIRDSGLGVDVSPADQVDDLGAYKAVVLGSAVYMGQWRKEAARFLKEKEAALAQLPVWLFSSGPSGEGDPVEQAEGWRFPKGLQGVADRIRPRGTTLFGGLVDPKKLNFIERWMLTNVGAPDGDYRDWEAIRSWAGSIADALADGA